MVAILGVLVLAPGLGAQPTGKGPRIGVLLNTSATRNLADLQQGLRELVMNLKTARTLGLSVPPTLRLQADQVIE